MPRVQVKPKAAPKSEAPSVPSWTCKRLVGDGKRVRVRASTWYQARELGMVLLACGQSEIAVAQD